MHRYREFGLVSKEDELLRRAFRDGFKRAGLSFPRFLEALGWYRDHARPGADEAHLAEAFSEFAGDRGWPAEHRDGAVDVYRAIRDNGPAAVTDDASRPDDDRATVARSEELLRSDPARYWRDGELQDAVFEARERLGDLAEAEGAMPPPQSNADQQQIEEIEALLHDPSGAGQHRYWNDDALRAHYGQALARRHGEAGSPESDGLSPTAPSASGNEGVPPAIS
jgi:hypothetical protein